MIETAVEYENGGRIDVYRMVDKSAGDFKNVFACCDYFARQGKRAVIMPKVHYKDSLYKEIYSQLVINDCGVGHVWAQRNIYDRVRNGSDIKEVWILNNTGQLARLC